MACEIGVLLPSGLDGEYFSCGPPLKAWHTAHNIKIGNSEYRLNNQLHGNGSIALTRYSMEPTANCHDFYGYSPGIDIAMKYGYFGDPRSFTSYRVAVI